MAARRTRRGQRRRRGRFGFLYKLLSFILIVAAVLIGCAVFFRVDQVQVLGHDRYTAEEIIQASEIRERDNLFLLNKGAIARQIYTRLPYVDDVLIYRDYPDTLVIEVRECTAAAAVESPDAWWLLNARGKLVERTDAATAAGYPPVTGLTPVAPMVGSSISVVEEESMKLQSLKELMTQLEDLGMAGGVEYYDFTSANEIRFGYQGRFTVKLPMSGSDLRLLLRTVDRGVRETLSDTDRGVFDATLKDVHFIPES